MCRQTSFAGACSGPAGTFTCEGDAVQCAIAREQHARNCQFYDVSSARLTEGNEIIAGTAVLAGDPRSSVEGVDLSEKLNVTPRLGQTCPEDRTVTLNLGSSSHSFQIPWSALCPYLQIAGQFGVVLTLIAGLRIIFGG